MVANDGVRLDDPARKQIIPRDYLIEATDWRQQPPAFQPKTATPYYGYGYQFWLFPGEKRRFAMLGVYGQMILVDPQLKLVMVQTTANATAKAGLTSLPARRPMPSGAAWWSITASGNRLHQPGAYSLISRKHHIFFA